MVMLDLDNEVYENIRKAMEDNVIDKVEYPTIKNFVDKNMRKVINKIKKEQKEE